MQPLLKALHVLIVVFYVISVKHALDGLLLVVENCFGDVRDDLLSDWLVAERGHQHVIIRCGNVSAILRAADELSTEQIVALVTLGTASALEAAILKPPLAGPLTRNRPRFLSLNQWYRGPLCNHTQDEARPRARMSRLGAYYQDGEANGLDSRLFLLKTNLYPVLEKHEKFSSCDANNWKSYLQNMLNHIALNEAERGVEPRPLMAYIYYENGAEMAAPSRGFVIGPAKDQEQNNTNNSVVDHCKLREDQVCLDGLQLSKTFYRVGIIEYPPYVMETQEDNGGKRRYEGAIVDIVKTIASKLNFNFTFVMIPEYGELLEDGTWNGAIGYLLRGEIDLIAADISITTARSKVVDFTVPYMQGSKAIAVRRLMQSTSFKELLATHLRPFHWTIWLTICVSLVIATALFTYALKPRLQGPAPAVAIQAGRAVHYDDDAEPQEKETWWSIFFQMLGIFCQQGCNLSPTRPSGRVILYTVCLTSLATYNFYTSVFISFTTVTKNVMPINTLLDILKDKSYMIGYEYNDRIEEMFKTSEVDLFRRAWRRIRSSGLEIAENMQAGLDKVYTSNYAFIGESNSLEWYVARNCSLRLLQERFLTEGYYFAFPQGSNDTVFFSRLIKRLLENGMVNRFLSSHMPSIASDYCTDLGTLDAVGLDQMAGLFICLGIGFTVTLVSLWLEKIGPSDDRAAVKRVTIVVNKKRRF